MKPKILEKDLQKQILDYLRLRGVFCWKNHSTGIYKQSTGSYIPVGMKGVSDILAIRNGKLIAIEVKVGKNKPSNVQLEFIEKINENGGIAFLAYSLNDVIKALE